MPTTEKHQVHIFGIIVLIVSVLVLVFLIISAIYFSNMLKGSVGVPNESEVTFLLWTSVVLSIILGILVFISLFNIFRHRSIVYNTPTIQTNTSTIQTNTPTKTVVKTTKTPITTPTTVNRSVVEQSATPAVVSRATPIDITSSSQQITPGKALITSTTTPVVKGFSDIELPTSVATTGTGAPVISSSSITSLGTTSGEQAKVDSELISLSSAMGF